VRPTFAHDCNSCEFVGQARGYDVYICRAFNKSRPSVLARYGNEGPDYISHYWDRLLTDDQGVARLMSNDALCCDLDHRAVVLLLREKGILPAPSNHE
jgi:hypothetical protein